MKKVHVTKNYRRYRQFPPGRCAKGSFRMKRSGSTLLVICCPRGKWNSRRRRCRVGTKAQSVLKRRKR